MIHYETHSVGDSIDKIDRSKKIKKSLYETSGKIPIIDQGGEFIAGWTSSPEYLFDDIPLTVFGDHTRRLKYLTFPFACGADGTQLLKAKKDFVQRFFYYALCNLKLKNYGYERHFKYLKDEMIPKPSIVIQQKIATILSNYDNLIENNEKRIKLLEQMAKLIYEEWFVKFKFPGHENVKMIDSKTEFGKIPEGWEVGKLKKIYSLLPGFAYKSNDFNPDGKFGLIKIRNLDNQFIDIENVDHLNVEKERFELVEGDFLIAMTGAQIGKVGLMPKLNDRLFLNQRVGKFVINNDFLTNNMFIYLLVKSEDFQKYVNNVSLSSSAQPNISGTLIEEYKMILPNNENLKKFNDLLEPAFFCLLSLRAKNQNLRKTRDFLLPKLISGEVDVSDLDIKISEEVANT